MIRVAVTGYASLDHVATLAAPPRPGVTTHMRRLPGAWPRLGGSPAYVALALAAAGVADPTVISWVGADAAGDAYRAALAAHGLPGAGIATLQGETPVALLAYVPDGGCICLYDPGPREPAALLPAQAAMVAEADWVCVTVGPQSVSTAVLDLIRPATRLAWAVKDDRHAVPPALAARLAGRADLICFSCAEAAFVAAARQDARGTRPGATLVETHGAAGASIAWDGRRVTLPATPLPVTDPTGAGDTLVGGLIAALAAAPGDRPEALAAGIEAAAAMLRARHIKEPA